MEEIRKDPVYVSHSMTGQQAHHIIDVFKAKDWETREEMMRAMPKDDLKAIVALFEAVLESRKEVCR